MSLLKFSFLLISVASTLLAMALLWDVLLPRPCVHWAGSLPYRCTMRAPPFVRAQISPLMIPVLFAASGFSALAAVLVEMKR